MWKILAALKVICPISWNLFCILVLYNCKICLKRRVQYGKSCQKVLKRTLKVQRGCILWTGCCDRHGYGRKRVTWHYDASKTERVHRMAYMVNHKLTELPRTSESGELLEISHLCHQKLCINPEHLVIEAYMVNMSRAHCFVHGACS